MPPPLCSCAAAAPRRTSDPRPVHSDRQVGVSRLGPVAPHHDVRPGLFARDILPRLGTVKLAAIIEATRCCKATASRWRNGHTTPQVSPWPALADLVKVVQAEHRG